MNNNKGRREGEHKTTPFAILNTLDSTVYFKHYNIQNCKSNFAYNRPLNSTNKLCSDGDDLVKANFYPSRIFSRGLVKTFPKLGGVTHLDITYYSV